MLAVACVGLLAYAVAGAAPGDGRDLAPAESTTSTTKGAGGTTSTTGKDACAGSTTSSDRKSVV